MKKELGFHIFVVLNSCLQGLSMFSLNMQANILKIKLKEGTLYVL